MNAQVAVLLSAEGAAQEMPSVPLRVSMMLVRFVSCAAPQKVVFVIHVHLRFWQFQTELPSPEPRSCVHVSAVQKNCSTPS